MAESSRSGGGVNLAWNPGGQLADYSPTGFTA